ncbi:SAM-dependent DNA methyltransferase [Colwellia sp. MB3u-70]|uniref:type I restriction-modification system subunit M n=1 Tax=unclassified Colwellia TaxID=196834 RepID=UPI0015F4F317|nr:MULTISPECIES: class I SAM-dependent DNA methyltransferase [unclassified Colwellia]MBA6292855.1 SAM-dependent DNA methyltransferase [Colwellia sp. MB3u-8]MBA6308061.1 SAM-dependent DNA methyltransferase [Colwellia sp. MB3u-70]
MITGPLKSKIDKLWEEFWTGGITNPLTVIEQITFLMYARMLDMNEQADEKRSARTNKPFSHRFNQQQQHLRWQNIRHLGAEELYKTVKDELFPFFASSSSDSVTEENEGSIFSEFMKDAQLMIQKQSLLVKAVEMVNDLPLDNSDTKGDLYEYLLSKLTTAGINGQFRTPRHIIRAMVEIMDPDLTSRICDPSTGTGGFLSVSYEYLLEKYTSKEGIEREPIFITDGDGRGNGADEDKGQPLLDIYGKQVENILYSGDLIEPEARAHIDTDMFHGFDFDATMLRVAAMNLVMHGIKQPDIHYQDTLSQRFSENFPNEANGGMQIILANPPFKGTLDEEDVCPELLRKVKTKKTELLFVALIERMLQVGGRSATIVPDGVLFGSSKAHVQLRQLLVDNNQLEAVISLPSGVFKPYAGVSTAILIFTKGGSTDHVWFYDVKADGFSLDDKRTPIKANDLPSLVAEFKARDKTMATSEHNDKTQQAFWVSKAEIIGNKYDLSINRYKEVVYEEEVYEAPKVILSKLVDLENEIMIDLKALEGMLK